MDAVNAKHDEAMSAIAATSDALSRVEVDQIGVVERLTRVEEGQKGLDEGRKEVAKSISDVKADIRAIWHPALGAFFGQNAVREETITLAIRRFLRQGGPCRLRYIC